jgi:alcohol dehydrogenase class IV
MRHPELWSLERLIAEAPRPAGVVATRSVLRLCSKWLPLPAVSSLDELPPELGTLIVIGGGTLIDAAKIWRADHCPETMLAAIPSIWGSGAEATHIAVVNFEQIKNIRVDDLLAPDVRVIIPELAQTLSRELVVSACGDCWAHAVEGFLSPLAQTPLRRQLAGTIRGMLNAGIENRPEWFELSAASAAGQAESSVGLIHAMAHVLEGPLRYRHNSGLFNHAKLCSVLAWPVVVFNDRNSGKWAALCTEYDLDKSAIEGELRYLYDDTLYDALLPLMEQMWLSIMRDPCSRTNGVLVRASHISFFTEKRFQ